jgi:hypothetical protein
MYEMFNQTLERVESLFEAERQRLIALASCPLCHTGSCLDAVFDRLNMLWKEFNRPLRPLSVALRPVNGRVWAEWLDESDQDSQRHCPGCVDKDWPLKQLKEIEDDMATPLTSCDYEKMKEHRQLLGLELDS